ncbi:VirB3 family type IV secretion system protein [Vibrio parahaemolyticus]|uniref:type IV secretion system protein VirB3 n=1 Tax=Vibrio parahaemolyticus TaxID=670 RepID=UPI00280666E9|nr:VirB3 family type IV secretion system protein [Vibrio parahaemolyticus]EJE4644424.1 VirB3 family type IV secretion system protein [Vibrio parahaemolyticus]ELA9292971.1 VirB3 family type IV secretion system protein [Vibrio parahaemolyticus]MDS1925667.1 VirB3 family type IV secretion system protein [Vibrio parahaemolyticus]HCG8016774.1 VirB3 family type IV secretion system protein [Vibrio parahaemolyticus]
MSHEPFPLFKGATRVATFWGVPMMPLMVMFMVVAVSALTISIWFWVLAIPAWFIMAQITRYDDKAFRIWGLWIETKLRNRNKKFWGASSYAPTSYKKRR